MTTNFFNPLFCCGMGTVKIRIRDPQHCVQCYECGSFQNGILLTNPDPHPGPPDPDPYPFKPNVKLKYTFSPEDFIILSKTLKRMRPMNDAVEK
jgi:hypothetical protein